MSAMEEDPDIDIEENPLMYPRIESIYSDVNIKTEPIDIDDDYNSIEISENSSDYYMPFRNKIIIGSKPSSTPRVEPIPGPSTAPDAWEDQNLFECAECNLLFPTRNELDSHRMASHSFLVARPMSRAIKTEKRISVSSASSRSYLEESSSQDVPVRRQKAVKSTAKSALNKTFPTLLSALKINKPYLNADVPITQNKPNEQNDRLLCKHCGIKFPDEIALIKHTYELLPENQFEDSQKKLQVAENVVNDFDPYNDDGLFLQCLYCTCYFKQPKYLNRHFFKNHKVTEFALRQAKYPGKCTICSKTYDTYRQHNNHIVKSHRKVFISRTLFISNGKASSSPSKMKCLICNQIFPSRYTAYKHKAEKHPEYSQKKTFLKVFDKPVKQLPSLPLKTKLQASKNILKSNYIPKQNLFKCNKCQIHFVSCSAAFAHSKRCSLAKGDWKCNKCRRTFTKTEIFVHTQQHQFSEKFKVHIVCDKILSKVLCRCPKCELLFDEVAFGTHVSEDCMSTNGVECKSCDLKIHSDSYAKHRRYHSKYNFSSADFILIEFVDISFQISVKKEKTGQYKKKLMYCTICTCHFYKPKKFHLDNQCVELRRKLCTICGLTFSQKPYITHEKYDHGVLNLKLEDIKFQRIQDYKVINPVMPDFFQCDVCKVRFLSTQSRNHHSCSKQVFVKCAKCSEKFDTVTYDIHLTFHNYGRSKSKDDCSSESSTLLRIYSCVTCNYGFDTYDNVVEHCQKHYINSEVLPMKPCKLCKLSFADGHKALHSNRVKFEILKFNYERLLSDDWLDGFDSLGKDVIDDILSKSVYGALRNVHLELLVEGPSERTLYKCAKCELNFDQDNVVEHTTESCSSSPHFDCGSCTATFKTRVAKNNHMNIHVVYGDDIMFREIVFNNDNDKELNDALRTGRQKESLKFRKCQQCKLLIKISDYQAHITAHDQKIESSQYTIRRNDKMITYKLFKPTNAAKKLYTVYKCKTCNACVRQKVNMVRHRCLTSDNYEKCSKCSLYFLSWNIKRHIEEHKRVPNFIPKNICILQFQILPSKDPKKRRRYSSDDDASTNSREKVIVSKAYDTRKVIGRPYSDNLSEDSQDNTLGYASAETSQTSNAYAKKYIKKNCIEKVEREDDSVELQSETRNSIVPKKNPNESKLDIDNWRIDTKNKLYQCERCYLFFVTRQLLLTHLLECDANDLSEIPLVCDQCDVIFHPSLISFHEKLHELVRQNPIENYFFLINISTNGVGTNDERRWIYKCKTCDINYLHVRTIDSHINLNHGDCNVLHCKICDLKFTQISRTKHMRVQHIENKWSLDDLHIEITEKKVVSVGEINLKAFVGPQSLNKIGITKIEGIAGDENQSKAGTDIDIKPCLLTIEPLNEDTNTVNSETSNEIEVPMHESEKIDHNLYKCEQCSNHYMTKLQLVRHNFGANHKGASLRCDICGLSFGVRMLMSHKTIQHTNLKLDLKDFVINNLNFNQNALKREAFESGDRESLPNQIEGRDTPMDTSISQSEEDKKIEDSFTKDMKKISNKLKYEISGPIDNRLYKCVECSVYYINRRTLLLHIVIKKHNQHEYVRCDICGLLFGRGSLHKHKTVQHNKLKLTRKDFIITDVFGCQLDDDENDQTSTKYASSVDTDDIPLTELGDKIQIEDKREVENEKADEIIKDKNDKIFRLYQCKDCRICVSKSERKLHVCCSDIQKKQCIRCCLSFRRTDIIQHKRLHQKYRELSRKNFILIRFGRRTDKDHKIYKCVSCSTHFVSFVALEYHLNAFNHKTKRKHCNDCGLFFGKYSLQHHVYIHHKKLNLKVQQFNIIHVSDVDMPLDSKEIEAKNSNSINTTVSERDPTTNVNVVKKLFKCVECDVYFLTRASYYHHIYKHRKLDATEYVDCNICDFQFLNESLGVHMKSHKDKSFCLDKLLIEEYQPNSTDAPKIEFYFAKDGLNSKLVSTTTPFDNDDEAVVTRTDEQLSIIDSTSDEMPKVKTVEMTSANPNTYPHDSSLEEATLNPVVVLPNNLEVSINDGVK